MAKRQIKVQILPGGQVSFNNAGNPDEKRILAELAELAQLISGDAGAFKVEKHEHTLGHSHVAGEVHSHG
jgi:hypothetical protein